MHLLSSTTDFKIGGRPLPGFPILLWEDMQSCQEANLFLRHYLLRGVIGSKKSWVSTGRALYDFFSFLEVHELPWNDVDRGEAKTLIAAYRDYCFEDVGLRRNTVRQRLLYVCKFYEFAKHQGWIDNLPYEYEDRSVVRPGGFLAHVEAAAGFRSIRTAMPRAHKTLPKFLTKDQVKALLGAAENPHHYMIIRVALQTGLRREELATLPVAYVIDPNRSGMQGRNIRVNLDPQDGTGMKTKGSKERVIIISRHLMKDLFHYVNHVRGERACLSDHKHNSLFLNQFGMPWADDGKGMERMVSSLGRKVGIKTHPHMLRHTYATHTLVALQRDRGETRIEPLVFVQKQLGHASILTTMVYLHLINELADEAVLAYDDELNEWADNG